MKFTLPFGLEFEVRRSAARGLSFQAEFLGLELALRKIQPSDAPPPPRAFSIEEGWYSADSLHVVGKNLDFLADPRFIQAYQRGMSSGHKIGRPKGSTLDIHVEWRVYTCCWAASQASRLPGDFVECGVNTGICSLAICEYLNLAQPTTPETTNKDRMFWLFDTFEGIPEDQMTNEEKAHSLRQNEKFYEDCWDLACRNFAPYPNTRLVRGRVPESLHTVSIERVAYLSIDMNIVEPEIAAIEFFWDRLVPGALVVLDDYGWQPHRAQYEAMNRFAESHGAEIYALPTGQGLLIKP